MTTGNVVVRLPNWIGDIVMALPVLDRLRRHAPDGAVAVQVHARGRDLVEGLPGLARIHPVPARGGPRWPRVLRELRAARYDTGLLLTSSFSSALLFALGGVGERVGWSSELRDPLLTRGVRRPPRTTRLSGQYQALLAALGLDGPVERPRFRPPEAARDAAARWLAARGLSSSAPIALAPGAAFGTAKRWPTARYRELARCITQGAGTPVVVVGGPNEEALLMEVGGGIPGAYVLAGTLPLSGTAALLERCHAVVSNDSGLLHLAAAVDAPVVGLYGSTAPEWTAPDSKRLTILHLGLSCSPCFRRECPLAGEERLACLTGIGVEDVLAALATVPAVRS